MGPARFDQLIQSLGRATSRRAALGALAALGLGMSEATDAKPRKKACPPCKQHKHGKCKPAPDGTSCGDCKVCQHAICGADTVGTPCVVGFCNAAGTCEPCNAGEPCPTGLPGVCSEGALNCSGQRGPVCVPTIRPGDQRELCDGLDNDCDGVIDNGFDLMNDVDNCGRCGNVCSVPNGLAGCRQGQCGIAACAKGWADCNNDPRDGCEAKLGTNENCGHCGDACGVGEACVSGTCTPN
jgi:hypothetical protein